MPEMIEIAGGQDVLGVAGAKSRTAEWDELAASAPDVIVAMPCGWDAARARAEVEGRMRRRLGRHRRGADLGGRCCGLVLAPRAAPGRGNGAARPSASPG